MAVPGSGNADAVGAVVVDGAGRILLVCRGQAPLAGTWTLPGGKMREGEAPEDAVVREVWEETGIPIRVVRPLGLVELESEGYTYRIAEFSCVPTGDNPLRAADDATGAVWAARSALDAHGVPALAQEVIRRAFER